MPTDSPGPPGTTPPQNAPLEVATFVALMPRSPTCTARLTLFPIGSGAAAEPFLVAAATWIPLTPIVYGCDPTLTLPLASMMAPTRSTTGCPLGTPLVDASEVVVVFAASWMAKSAEPEHANAAVGRPQIMFIVTENCSGKPPR